MFQVKDVGKENIVKGQPKVLEIGRIAQTDWRHEYVRFLCACFN